VSSMMLNTNTLGGWTRQLLRIEEEMGKDAVYAGKTYRKPAWMGN
jgi:hypothetical protein